MTKTCACRSLCWNLLPVNENELAGATPTKDNSTFIPTLIVLRVPTSASAIALSLDNKLFK